MVKPEWGIKRICPNCGTRYYDFRKSPPICPNCGTAFDPEALIRSRRSRSGQVDDLKRGAAAGSAVEALPDDAEATLETDDEVADDDTSLETGTDDDESDDSMIEDASELGEDSADVEVDVEDDDDR